MKLVSAAIGVVLIGLVIGMVDRAGTFGRFGLRPVIAGQQVDNDGAAIADRLLRDEDWR